jgi:hypothetical protein
MTRISTSGISLELDMEPFALSHAGTLALGLDQPGKFLHWSFIEISLANLIVIAVMMLIFGAALLIRFPHADRGILPPEEVTDE